LIPADQAIAIAALRKAFADGGNITLAGSRRFRGGVLDGTEGHIVVSGRLSPNPRP
jgi:hypothetical protein